MWKCKHCNEEIGDSPTVSERANHTRWCKKNPKRGATQIMRDAMKGYHNKQLGEIKAFSVVCNTCNADLIVEEREKKHPLKEAYYCNRSCANSQGGKARVKMLIETDRAHYRTICKMYHEFECLICKENKIVSVHHYDFEEVQSTIDEYVACWRRNNV